MKKIMNNIAVYFRTIKNPKLVVDLVYEAQKAIEMVNYAYKRSSEALELTNQLYDKTKLIHEQRN